MTDIEEDGMDEGMTFRVEICYKRELLIMLQRYGRPM